MVTEEFARRFADEWAAAWNARDLEAVLSHYVDDFEMSSPFIARLTGEASGTLRGKQAVGAYWRAALERLGEFRFEVREVFVGAESVSVRYKAVLGLEACEVFFLNADRKVYKAAAHYTGLSA